ncbi:unnamed protein product [Bathycoccus prasinos]
MSISTFFLLLVHKRKLLWSMKGESSLARCIVAVVDNEDKEEEDRRNKTQNEYRNTTATATDDNKILLRHPRKHKNACNCSQPGSPDESGGENTKVRAPRMEFLRNALFVFIIGVVVVVVVVVIMVIVVLLLSVRVLRPAHKNDIAEEERTQKHAFFALEKNIARAFDVSSLTRSSNQYKKTSEGIRMKSISSPRIRKKTTMMRQIELIR